MTSIFQYKFNIDGTIYKDETIQSFSIRDLEQNVYNSVNDLYSTYVKYIRCTNNTTLSECSTKPTQEELEQKYTKANDSIMAFNTAIEKIQEYISELSQNEKSTDDLNALMQNYNKVLESRADLDNKLDELINTNSSFSSKTNFIKSRYNDSVYASVLLTAFASSLLYFLFFKMK